MRNARLETHCTTHSLHDARCAHILQRIDALKVDVVARARNAACNMKALLLHPGSSCQVETYGMSVATVQCPALWRSRRIFSFTHGEAALFLFSAIVKVDWNRKNHIGLYSSLQVRHRMRSPREHRFRDGFAQIKTQRDRRSTKSQSRAHLSYCTILHQLVAARLP